MPSFCDETIPEIQDKEVKDEKDSTEILKIAKQKISSLTKKSKK